MYVHSWSCSFNLLSFGPESIEWIIEGQALSRLCDLAPPPPFPSPVTEMDRQHPGGGGGVGEEPNHTTERAILSAQEHEENNLVTLMSSLKVGEDRQQWKGTIWSHSDTTAASALCWNGNLFWKMRHCEEDCWTTVSLTKGWCTCSRLLTGVPQRNDSSMPASQYQREIHPSLFSYFRIPTEKISNLKRETHAHPLVPLYSLFHQV